MTLEIQTKSATVDQIKQVWRMIKTKEFPIPGDYYYNQIDCGILFNKPIIIKSEHLPLELKEYLAIIKPEERHQIFDRVILEIFSEKFGVSYADSARKENRIRVRYV